MRTILRLALAVAAILGAIAIFVQQGDQHGEPRVVATAEVSRGDVRKMIEATGVVKAQVGGLVRIGARATGTIKEMRVRVGNPVKAGEVIALIDDQELLDQLGQAHATLEKATAEKQRIEDVYPCKIAEAEAQLKLAEAQWNYARNNATRLALLYKQNFISKDSFEVAEREELVTGSTVRAAMATLELNRSEFPREQEKADKAVEESAAALQALEIRISYTEIISPIDGVVSQVGMQQGETVVAGLQVANLITVLDPARLEMWIYMDETDVGQVKVGTSVEFTMDAYPDTVFRGEVDTVRPQPEIRDSIVYYQALVRLDPRDAATLRPEMTTQCRIVAQEKHRVLVIPNSAIKWVDNQQAVFRVENGKPEWVSPELGLAGQNTTEVISGLKEGQIVATQIVLPVGTRKPAFSQ